MTNTRVQDYLAGNPAAIEAFENDLAKAQLLAKENGHHTTALSETVSPARFWFLDLREALVQEESAWQAPADAMRAQELRRELDENYQARTDHDKARPDLYKALGAFGFWLAQQGIGPASWREHYQKDEKLHSRYIELSNDFSSYSHAPTSASRARARVEDFFQATGLSELESSVAIRFRYVEMDIEYFGRPMSAEETLQYTEELTGQEFSQRESRSETTTVPRTPGKIEQPRPDPEKAQGAPQHTMKDYRKQNGQNLQKARGVGSRARELEEGHEI